MNLSILPPFSLTVALLSVSAYSTSGRSSDTPLENGINPTNSTSYPINNSLNKIYSQETLSSIVPLITTRSSSHSLTD